MDKITLVSKQIFDSTLCNFFSSGNQIYMTRKQIGEALEYKNPDNAIKDIHSRHKDRLDPLSMRTVVYNNDDLLRSLRPLPVEFKKGFYDQLSKENAYEANMNEGSLRPLPNKNEGNSRMQESCVYSLRGIMEICRLSRQPKADRFMDFAWNVMEAVNKGDLVASNPQPALTPEAFKTMMDSYLPAVLNPIQDELKAINKRLETPALPAPASGISHWRRYIYKLVNSISELSNGKFSSKDVLSYLYGTLRKKTDFDEDSLRAEYAVLNPYAANISTIALIESRQKYMNDFESIVKEAHDKAIKAAVRDQLAKKQDSSANRAIELCDQLAAMRNDNSRGHTTTYRLIYRCMENVNWDEYYNLYKDTFGIRALTRKTLLVTLPELRDKFIEAALKIIESYKENGYGTHHEV